MTHTQTQEHSQLRAIMIGCTLLVIATLAHSPSVNAQKSGASNNVPTAVSVDRQIPIRITAIFNSAIGPLQPAVRQWLAAQAAKLRGAQLLADAFRTALPSAINERFKTQKVSDDGTRAIAFLVLIQAVKDIDEDRRYLLEQLRSVNEFASAIAKFQSALSTVSQELASKEETAPCDLPICRTLNEQYAALVKLRFASVSVDQRELRTRRDLVDRRAELKIKESKLDLERQKITDLKHEAEERFDKAMEDANSELIAGVISGVASVAGASSSARAAAIPDSVLRRVDSAMNRIVVTELRRLR